MLFKVGCTCSRVGGRCRHQCVSGTSSWRLNLPKDWWWGALLLFYNCIWPHFGVELKICKILFKSTEFKGIFVESFFGQQPPIPAAHLAGSSEEESAVCVGGIREDGRQRRAVSACIKGLLEALRGGKGRWAWWH